MADDNVETLKAFLEFIASLGETGGRILQGIFSNPWTGVPFMLMIFAFAEESSPRFQGLTSKFLTQFAMLLESGGAALGGAIAQGLAGLGADIQAIIAKYAPPSFNLVINGINAIQGPGPDTTSGGNTPPPANPNQTQYCLFLQAPVGGNQSSCWFNEANRNTQANNPFITAHNIKVTQYNINPDGSLTWVSGPTITVGGVTVGPTTTQAPPSVTPPSGAAITWTSSPVNSSNYLAGPYANESDAVDLVSQYFAKGQVVGLAYQSGAWYVYSK
jgi:hypothetical protein